MCNDNTVQKIIMNARLHVAYCLGAKVKYSSNLFTYQKLLYIFILLGHASDQSGNHSYQLSDLFHACTCSDCLHL